LALFFVCLSHSSPSASSRASLLLLLLKEMSTVREGKKRGKKVSPAQLGFYHGRLSDETKTTAIGVGVDDDVLSICRQPLDEVLSIPVEESFTDPALAEVVGEEEALALVLQAQLEEDQDIARALQMEEEESMQQAKELEARDRALAAKIAGRSADVQRDVFLRNLSGSKVTLLQPFEVILSDLPSAVQSDRFDEHADSDSADEEENTHDPVTADGRIKLAPRFEDFVPTGWVKNNPQPPSSGKLRRAQKKNPTTIGKAERIAVFASRPDSRPHCGPVCVPLGNISTTSTSESSPSSASSIEMNCDVSETKQGDRRVRFIDDSSLT